METESSTQAMLKYSSICNSLFISLKNISINSWEMHFVSCQIMRYLRLTSCPKWEFLDLVDLFRITPLYKM